MAVYRGMLPAKRIFLTAADAEVDVSSFQRSGRFGTGFPSGFTLIELLAVITLVGVLSAMALGMGRHAVIFSQTARAKAELAAIAAALESYKQQFGDYPRTDRPDELLQALVGKRGPTGSTVSGRLLLELAHFQTADAADPLVSTSAELVDPWKQTYAYAYRSDAGWTNPDYVLFSSGPDGNAAALLAGGTVDETAPANADNIYADR